MKTQTTHTPTPWTVSENENTPLTLNEYHRIHAGIDDICFVEKTDRDLSSEKYIGVDQANAAFIVRAVNAHMELVAYLAADHKGWGHPDGCSGCVLLSKVGRK